MLLAWLLTPIDPVRVHDVAFYASWHGRLMTLAWSFLVPVGVVIARYYKVTAKQDWPNIVDNRFWWRCHLFCQITALLLMVIAMTFMWMHRGFVWVGTVHILLGWLIVMLAGTQLLGGMLRGSKGGPTNPGPDGSLRGDHYDMTRRRLAFEAIHKNAGYVAVVIAQIVVISGLWQVNAPRWMWLGMIAWWCFLVLFVGWRERMGRCPDTYQALWGPDPIHPGNQRRQGSRQRWREGPH